VTSLLCGWDSKGSPYASKRRKNRNHANVNLDKEKYDKSKIYRKLPLKSLGLIQHRKGF